ncbi:hypothetical protein LB505_000713 [Fusarium chuoi]|nr:hypothetical protein LB505_000713 [Fusarium chuoi]
MAAQSAPDPSGETVAPTTTSAAQHPDTVTAVVNLTLESVTSGLPEVLSLSRPMVCAVTSITRLARALHTETAAPRAGTGKFSPISLLPFI